MKICFFGIYNPTYSRNQILLKGMKNNGVEITQCRVDPRQIKGLKKYWVLWNMGRRLNKNDFDFIFVPFPGHTVVWLAKLIFRKQKIIFDVFLSLLDANLNDRKVYSKYSIRALKDYLLDKTSCNLGDILLADTDMQVKYLSHKYGNRNKFITVYVGSDDELFYPGNNGATNTQEKNYRVHFHGTFVPVHGIDVILKSAKILEDENIIFKIVGKGQTLKENLKLANELAINNVDFIQVTGYDLMRSYILQSDLCLGVFGKAERLDRVIPNKIYEYAACAKPMITASSTAIEECFIPNEEIFFSEKNNPEDLARQILFLKNNPDISRNSANRAYNKFKNRFTADTIVSKLLKDIRQML